MGNNAYSTNPFDREQWSRPVPTEGQPGAWERGLLPRERGTGASLAIPSAANALRILPLAAALALVVFLLAAALGAAQEFLASTETPSAAVAVPLPVGGAEAEELPASTPRDQWRQGEVPFLYQIDSAWASAPYINDTVGESGCGPTSLTMVYVALTGRTDYDPPAMAAFSEQNGYVEEGLTAWRLMTDGAAQLGLASHEVPASAASLVAELEAGHPVICTVGPGDFTDKGHFLVVAGLAENGELIVRDPNSAENSAQTWDVQRVLNQCRNLWAFERA